MNQAGMRSGTDQRRPRRVARYPRQAMMAPASVYDGNNFPHCCAAYQ